MSAGKADWPLWEGFVRAKRGVSHVHAGTVHAPDAELALQRGDDREPGEPGGLAREIQPHAGAASPPVETTVEGHELLEDPLLVLRGDAGRYGRRRRGCPGRPAGLVVRSL